MYAQIDRIFLAAQEAGIPIVPLKGAFLAKCVYRDIALRPMCDIDLMCRVEDRDGDELEDILRGLGFSLFERWGGRAPYREVHTELFTARPVGRDIRLPNYYHPRRAQVETLLNIFHG